MRGACLPASNSDVNTESFDVARVERNKIKNPPKPNRTEPNRNKNLKNARLPAVHPYSYMRVCECVDVQYCTHVLHSSTVQL